MRVKKETPKEWFNVWIMLKHEVRKREVSSSTLSTKSYHSLILSALTTLNNIIICLENTKEMNI